MITLNVKKIIALSFCTFIPLETNAAIQTGQLSSDSTVTEGAICTTSTAYQSYQSNTAFTCTKPLTNGLTISYDHIRGTNGWVDATPNNNIIAEISNDKILLGSNTSAANNDVALGNNSKTTTVVTTASSTVAGNTYNHAGNNPTNAVSVGDKDKERVIQSVAAGQVSATSTDAVNGSQLYAAYDAINNMYQRQMAGYDSEIKQINQNIDDLKEGAYAGIAGALAIGNLPQPSAPGKNMISGGMGTYKGHSAAAFGFSSLSENEKIIWKMGASFDSNKNSGGAVSFGYQW
jgi:autotransporter adhesin